MFACMYTLMYTLLQVKQKLMEMKLEYKFYMGTMENIIWDINTAQYILPSGLKILDNERLPVSMEGREWKRDEKVERG